MTETNEVARTAAQELIKAAGGDAVIALQALLERTQSVEVPTVEKSTVATRKQAYREMWTEDNIEKMIEVNDILDGLIDRIRDTNLEGEGLVSTELATALMQEHLDRQAVTEAFDARKGLVKARIFLAIDALLAAQGIEDPQHHNGEVDVPELGLKFTREATSPGKRELDEGKLRVVLGEELWKKVCDKEIIPATVEFKLNTTRLLDLANADVSLLDKIAECIKPAVPQAGRLNVRKL